MSDLGAELEARAAARPTSAVLGFRPHTYWTALVALAGPADAPQVIERRRIEFAAGGERFAYHQAAEAPPGAGMALIEKVRAATTANVAREVAALAAELQQVGIAVELAVTPADRGEAPRDLAQITASHAAIHAAEGRFYRDVVADGCAAAGLRVARVLERELAATVAGRLGEDEAALEARLKAIGAAIGPPWSQDQKLAALAAWTGLDP